MPNNRRRQGKQIFYSTVTSSYWNNALGEGSPCITSKGGLGACTSYRNCYPYFKLPDLTIWESWVLGNYDTCTYFNGEGRQAFGVCCSNPVQSIIGDHKTDDNSITMPPAINEQLPEHTANKENNYPNWPPPIPTHPPDHAAPTHPTVSGSLPGTTPRPTTTTTTTTTNTPTWATKPTTAWPTKPPTISNWPPPVPTHSTSTTYAPPTIIDNDIPANGNCGAKNGFVVS